MAGPSSVSAEVKAAVIARDFGVDNNGLAADTLMCPGFVALKPCASRSECRQSLRDSFHVMHKVPTAQGGTNLADNLFIGCPRCNQEMGFNTASGYMEGPNKRPRKYYFERRGRPVRTLAEPRRILQAVHRALKKQCAHRLT